MRLTDSQVKALKEMLENEEVRGKKAISHILWLNTHEPKYKIGDCVHVTEDSGHRVYGHRVVNFHGKITKVSNWRDSEEFHYSLEGVVKCGDKQATVNYHAAESMLGELCEDNITVISTPASDYADEHVLSLKDLM